MLWSLRMAERERVVVYDVSREKNVPAVGDDERLRR